MSGSFQAAPGERPAPLLGFRLMLCLSSLPSRMKTDLELALECAVNIYHQYAVQRPIDDYLSKNEFSKLLKETAQPFLQNTLPVRSRSRGMGWVGKGPGRSSHSRGAGQGHLPLRRDAQSSSNPALDTSRDGRAERCGILGDGGGRELPEGREGFFGVQPLLGEPRATAGHRQGDPE